MSKVRLVSSHVLLDGSLVASLFGEAGQALVAYESGSKRLLITGPDNQWFAKLHKPVPMLLKIRNLKGDRSLAVREFLIDHDLDTADRPLTYEIIAETGLLKINL